MDLFSERFFENGVKVCGFAVLALLVLIFLFVAKEGLGAFGKVGDIYRFWGHWDTNWEGKKEYLHSWQSTGDVPKLSFLPLISGTFMVAVPAAIFAALLGTGVAIFLSEIAPRAVREVMKPALEMLASIPSVVIGFFCMVVLAGLLWNSVEPMQTHIGDALFDGSLKEANLSLYQKWIYDATRFNALVGALGVTIVILPLVASLSEEALRAVPQELRHASYALGAGRWQTILFVVVPAAIRGVGRSWLLGLGRGLGETMIVVMATGNAAVITLNPFQSVRTMTATIAAELGAVDQGGLVYHTLFLVGCGLFIITFFVNFGAQKLLRKGMGAQR